MDKLEPKKNKKPGITEIIFGILLSVFGMNLYMDFGVLYNVGLVLFITGLILIAFGVKNKILKNNKTSRYENLFVWSLTALVFIWIGVFAIKGVRSVTCAPGESGSIEPWCGVGFEFWLLVPILGIFILFIALINGLTKNK
jgi:hypothetical protein